jgi:hypothetical protein
VPAATAATRSTAPPGPTCCWARTGDDTLDGQGGIDLLCGASGTDRLTGGAGADRFGGGSGVDVATDLTTSQGTPRTARSVDPAAQPRDSPESRG